MLLVVKASAETERTARILAAVGDPVRLRFVQALRAEGELASSAAAETLGVSLALLCHHARILVEAGVIDKRKEAQTAYYSLNRKLLRDSLKGLV